MKKLICAAILFSNASIFAMSNDNSDDNLSDPYEYPQTPCTPCTPAFVPKDTVVNPEELTAEPQNSIAELPRIIFTAPVLENNRHPAGKIKKPGYSRIPGRYKCPDCGNKFTWTWGVVEHQKFACPFADVVRKKFKCSFPECGQQSKRPSDLRRHMKLPHPIKRGRPLLLTSKISKDGSFRANPVIHTIVHRPITRSMKVEAQ